MMDMLLYQKVLALSSLSHDLVLLRTALENAFPEAANRRYLDTLTVRNPSVTLTRLRALSLLPPLLDQAGIDTTRLTISRNPAGRPCLHTVPGMPALDFSLSHSAGHVACALLVGEGRVGIDVEEPVPAANAARIADRFFSEGERRLMETYMSSGLDLSLAFTRLWTVKEAMAKQNGRGQPLSFDAAIPPADLTIRSTTVNATGTQVTMCFSGV